MVHDIALGLPRPHGQVIMEQRRLQGEAIVVRPTPLAKPRQE